MMQSHMPSPARLGMTVSSPSHPPNQSPANPTSSPPQQSNPNPSSTASASGAPAAPTLTTSPSLLPLLPPLPRAQSLLHLMSSLASTLFDLSPNRAAWISSYRGSLPTFLPSPSPSPPPPVSTTKEAMATLTALQTQLFETVAELKETLDLQDARARLAREARAKDAALLAFAMKLRDAHAVLDRLLDDYADYRRDAKRPRGAAATVDLDDDSNSNFGASLHSKLKLDDILTYAHRISYTTFAPPEHGAGMPLRGALPPAPQDNEMRMSQLYQFADLDVGVPKKALESKSDGTAQEADSAPLFVLPPEEPPRPSTLPITVPAGWLPRDLQRPGVPVPPPGWKPGDPIELLPGVIKPEEQLRPSSVLMPVGVQPMVPRGQETITVAPVTGLDIEFSSTSDEYSSDAGSSDEDDED